MQTNFNENTEIFLKKGGTTVIRLRFFSWKTSKF